MRKDSFQKYYDLVENGQNQKAHQLAHKAFHSYRSHLAGSKYLLQMLLQLPILPQCSAAQPASVEVAALTKWIADLEEHKQTPEYRAAVELSKKRDHANSRVSQQIWQQNKRLATARELSETARLGWWKLTGEQQSLVIEYEGGCMERRLQSLMSRKSHPYRGAAAFVSDLQKGQHWCRRW